MEGQTRARITRYSLKRRRWYGPNWVENVGPCRFAHPSFRELRGDVSKAQLNRRGALSKPIVHEQPVAVVFLHRSVRFPSLYEGFGMPVLEAMARGAPVLTLAEVAGDAVALADPQDPPALAEAMIRALDDESLRAALKVKGFDPAKQFSREQTAIKTVPLYRELCG
jgi:glycosyltransferase involved in cell wall biosynthesis